MLVKVLPTGKFKKLKAKISIDKKKTTAKVNPKGRLRPGTPTRCSSTRRRSGTRWATRSHRAPWRPAFRLQLRVHADAIGRAPEAGRDHRVPGDLRHRSVSASVSRVTAVVSRRDLARRPLARPVRVGRLSAADRVPAAGAGAAVPGAEPGRRADAGGVQRADRGLADGGDEPRHERHQRLVHPRACCATGTTGRRSGCWRSSRTTRTSRYVLSVHRADVLRYQPDFAWDGVPRDDRHPFLILRGDETVGVVIIRVDGDVAHVELDYVTKRFRDFSPGRVRLARERHAARARHQHGRHVADTWSTRTTTASASDATGRRTCWRCDAHGHRQPDRDRRETTEPTPRPRDQRAERPRRSSGS